MLSFYLVSDETDKSDESDKKWISHKKYKINNLFFFEIYQVIVNFNWLTTLQKPNQNLNIEQAL